MQCTLCTRTGHVGKRSIYAIQSSNVIGPDQQLPPTQSLQSNFAAQTDKMGSSGGEMAPAGDSY